MRDLRDTALEKGKGKEKEKSHSTAIPVCLIKRWITFRNPSVPGTVQHLDHSLSSSVCYERHWSDTSCVNPFLVSLSQVGTGFFSQFLKSVVYNCNFIIKNFQIKILLGVIHKTNHLESSMKFYTVRTAILKLQSQLIMAFYTFIIKCIFSHYPPPKRNNNFLP